MHVDRLAWRTFGIGPNHGALCIELTVGKQAEAKTSHVLQAILDSKDMFPAKWLNIDVTKTESADDDIELYGLAQRVASEGFMISARVSGYRKPQFIDLCPWTSALIGPPRWLEFKVQQVEFDPGNEVNIKNKNEAYLKDNPGVLRYIIVPPGGVPKNVITYLAKSDISWTIAVDSPPIFGITLL